MYVYGYTQFVGCAAAANMRVGAERVCVCSLRSWSVMVMSDCVLVLFGAVDCELVVYF